jgi:hypothetical protein
MPLTMSRNRLPEGNLLGPYRLRKWLKSPCSAIERVKLYMPKSLVMPPQIVGGNQRFDESIYTAGFTRFRIGHASLMILAMATPNIPLLTTLSSLPFGGGTPFQAEVWSGGIRCVRHLKIRRHRSEHRYHRQSARASGKRQLPVSAYRFHLRAHQAKDALDSTFHTINTGDPGEIETRQAEELESFGNFASATAHVTDALVIAVQLFLLSGTTKAESGSGPRETVPHPPAFDLSAEVVAMILNQVYDIFDGLFSS